MTSEYSSIYSRFYLRITDYKFAELEEGVAKEMMNGWIRSALSKPNIRRLFSSISIKERELDEDPNTEETDGSGDTSPEYYIEYDMAFPTDDGADQDFIEEVIALGMVVEWLTPQVNSVLNTMQYITNSDAKFYSQANHLNELQALLKKNQSDLRKMIGNKGYISNSYISKPS